MKDAYAAIDPNIWSDPWFIDLDNAHKLVFIWLLTNKDRRNCAGIYDVHRHTIATGSVQTPEDTDKALKVFADSGKIYYEHNYIIIANWMKRTTYNTDDVRNYVIRHINSLPRSIKDKHPDIINHILEKAGQVSGQGPAQGSGQGGIVNRNKNRNLNKNSNPPTPLVAVEKPKAHLQNSAKVRDDGRSEWGRGVWISDAEWKSMEDTYGLEMLWDAVGAAEQQFASDQKEKTGPYVRAILKRMKEEKDGKHSKRS